MNEYDYYKERNTKGLKRNIIIAAVLILIFAAAAAAGAIYLEVVQLNEIGNYSGVYVKNILNKAVFGLISFAAIFGVVSFTNVFITRNLKRYFEQNSIPYKKLPRVLPALIIALLGAIINKDIFYIKALTFFNTVDFGKADPLFSKDISYYIFQRPFLMAIYQFMFILGLFIIVYTMAYYAAVIFSIYRNITLQDLKVRSIIRHNLINIAVLFIIKVFSYRFEKEGILYSSVVGVKGADYVDYNIWRVYFTVAPFMLLLLAAVSFAFIWKERLRKAAYTIALYPIIWVLVMVSALAVQRFIVNPNEINLENTYLKYNMEKTREAYSIDKIKNYEFPNMQELTPDIINRNIDTKNNIRIIDYKPTLDSNVQLQGNTNFYAFNDGDIINYNINNKDTPVFISAREIDKNKLPEKSYVNATFKYTHGYGIVINPINRITSEGQVDFILSGLRMDSEDKSLKITEPRIYYGELTKDFVIVNANGIKETDYDGNVESTYQGTGGIKLSLINRLLFAAKYGDLNMLISGFINSDSKLLLNREIISRAQKALPFLKVDTDPYIILTSDGRLKWILDAYTVTDQYPYAESYGNFNYIRNSAKIVVDAYDGSVKCYIIDKDDPIIKTYNKIYPGILSEDPIPSDIAQHMRYPEMMFKVQTEMMKRYHLDPSANPQNVSLFYGKQDQWEIAKYPELENMISTESKVRDIEPYYNMIKLPGNVGSKEELILMRPFTPTNKHNMVSWLAVRNSADKYGELILFNFPKNTNIYGPYQAEVKINQIDKVSKDITLWGQSGSNVFKGSLLVIPIENSVLYVEPIYIQSGSSAIPEVREIIVGYQKGEEFKYGIGTNLDEALNQLFTGAIQTPAVTQTPSAAQGRPADNTGDKGKTDEKIINDITDKYDALKKQLEELGNLINELKK